MIPIDGKLIVNYYRRVDLIGKKLIKIIFEMVISQCAYISKGTILEANNNVAFLSIICHCNDIFYKLCLLAQFLKFEFLLGINSLPFSAL